MNITGLRALFTAVALVLPPCPLFAGAQAQATPAAAEPANSPELTQDAADIADTSIRAFRAHLVSLFDQSNFAELDALAQQLRSQRLRFKGGGWQLFVYYNTLTYPGSLTATDSEWLAHIAKLQQWTQQRPDSPTPRIATAQAYLRFAWKARGNGFADTVTEEGWRLFRERVQTARDILEQTQKLAGTCPQWYRQMQTVALAQQWDRSHFDSLADDALANEPRYYYFAVAEANYLLPKWYGRPGDTEHYADEVADRTGGAEGSAVYFQIAAALNCCKRTQAPALSWPRILQGFAATEALYGATNHQRNVMAYLALHAGDLLTARQLFEQIGNDWDKAVWGSKAQFDAGRTLPATASTQ